ncbi:MAG: apolipoprotein N-acyltransferase, partial [Planctomycetota bacterium]
MTKAPELPTASKRYGPAVVSAVLLAAAHPGPVEYVPSWLAWFALVPWWYAILRDRGNGHGTPAYVFGLVHFTLAYSWLFQLHTAFPIAIASIVALYPLLLLLLVRKTASLGQATMAWMLVAVAIGVDYLRELALTGFPWADQGYAVARSHWALAQTADLGGVHLVALPSYLVNATLALGAVHFFRQKRKIGIPMKQRAALAVTAIACTVGALLYGASRVEEADFEPGPRVLLIQPAFPQGIKKEALAANPTGSEMFTRQVRLSQEALRKASGRGPDLVVWAETMIPGIVVEKSVEGEPGVFVPSRDSRTQLTAIARAVGVGHVPYRRFMGGAVTWSKEQGKRNSGLLVDGRGNIEGRFQKRHLTPCGEYLPIITMLPDDTRDAIAGKVAEFIPFLPDLVPGEAPLIPLEREGHEPVQLGGLICYEAIFGAESRDRAAKGADILMNLSNYGWYAP